MVVAIPDDVVVEEGLIVPPEELKVTRVPSATLLPYASFTIAVIKEVEVPSAVIVVGLAETDTEAGTPGTNRTFIELVAVPDLAVIVAVPVVVDEVKVAVAIPLVPVLLDAVIVPLVVVKSTVVSFTGLPLVSVTTTVMIEVEDPSAVILALSADIDKLEGEPAVKVTLVELLTLPEIAVTFAVVAVVDEVKVAVAIPSVVVV